MNIYNPITHVLDASIILAFFLDKNEKGEKAKAFFEEVKEAKYTIAMPAIWFYEVCNRIGRLKGDSALVLQERLFFYRDTFFPTVELDEVATKLAFDLMKKYQGVSFYDASYHALAIRTEAVFLTADEKYYQKTKREGSIEFF